MRTEMVAASCRPLEAHASAAGIKAPPPGLVTLSCGLLELQSLHDLFELWRELRGFRSPTLTRDLDNSVT